MDLLGTQAALLNTRALDASKAGAFELALRLQLAAYAMIPKEWRYILSTGNILLKLSKAEAALNLYDCIDASELNALSAATLMEKREEALAMKREQAKGDAGKGLFGGLFGGVGLFGGGSRNGHSNDGRSGGKSSPVCVLLSASNAVQQSVGGVQFDLSEPAEVLFGLGKDLMRGEEGGDESPALGDELLGREERAQAARLFLASHVLLPREQRFLIAAAGVLAKTGDEAAAVQLFGMIDDTQLKSSNTQAMLKDLGASQPVGGGKQFDLKPFKWRRETASVVKLQKVLRGFLGKE